MRKTVKHILSFDVEEYFQVEAAARDIKPEQWDDFEKRLPASVDLILSLLDEYNVKATFFILGWVATHESDVVKRIAKAGHEIASHGMNHQMIGRMDEQTFRKDLTQSKKILEDLTGQKVIGYRAPTFSITRKTSWAIDVLSEVGFEYDSSIFPVRHDRYGVADAPTIPHFAVGARASKILELPPAVLRICRTNFPVGGGGYLRLLPTCILTKALSKRDEPGMVYLHPWEFDPAQPKLPLTLAGQFRHRVNLSKTEIKLRKLLSQFEFTCVLDLLSNIKACVLEDFAYVD